eukprot:s1573_g4.t1
MIEKSREFGRYLVSFKSTIDQMGPPLKAGRPSLFLGREANTCRWYLLPRHEYHKVTGTLSCEDGVERYRCAKHCDLLEKALGGRLSQGMRTLMTLWQRLAVGRARERALRLQHQQQQRRRQRQMLAMLLKTRGQMLQRLYLSSWRMLLSFQGKEERRLKLDLMLQKARRKSCGRAFGAWKSHVALLRQALAQQRRSVLAAAFSLWKEQGAEALKEEFNDLWLKAVLLAARPLKSEDLARFRVFPVFSHFDSISKPSSPTCRRPGG